jgi:hypothetical protein
VRKHAYYFAVTAEQIDYFASHIKYFVFFNQYSYFATLNLRIELQNTEYYFGLFFDQPRGLVVRVSDY